MKIKTFPELLAFIKTSWTGQSTALNAMLDKLPENVRAEFAALKKSINDALEALPPTDQVPAAQEAAWALNAFTDFFQRSQEYAAGLSERLNKMVADLAVKATALNELQTQLNGLNAKVESGELLTKDKAKQAGDLRFEEGVQSVLPQVAGMRKEQIQLAGLPEPEASVLNGDAPTFKARFDQAVDNLKNLTKKGLKLGGKGDAWVKELAWQTKEGFTGRMTQLAELAPTMAIDPMQGNGGQSEHQPAPARGLTIA